MSSDPKPLSALGQDVRAALPELSEERQSLQRDRIRELGAARSASAVRTRPLVVVAGLVAAAAITFWLWPTPAPSPSSGTNQIAQEGVGAKGTGELAAGAGTPSQHLPANDGPEAAALADEPVVLEDGILAIAAGNARRVEAGPYSVEIEEQGACSVEWDAKTEQLDLVVTQGVVIVHATTSHHTVVAGDRVRATPTGVVVTSLEPKSRPPADAKGSAKWEKLAADGRYREAMVAARRSGVLGDLSGLGRTKLKVLADVTRLGGAPNESTSILSALRTRFPKSQDAKRAAFYLGRQAERAGHGKDAIKWYREYLKTSPKGSLVREVRGRLFGVLAKQKRHEEARQVAREYLLRHPGGPHTAAATRIANSKGR